jgi:hypothetical protein
MLLLRLNQYPTVEIAATDNHIRTNYQVLKKTPRQDVVKERPSMSKLIHKPHILGQSGN